MVAWGSDEEDQHLHRGRCRRGADAPRGRLHVHIDAGEFAARPAVTADLSGNEYGLGRELFRMFRANAVPAELGAGVL